MLRQTVKYGTGLIALYVVVSKASGFGQAFESGARGISSVTKTLQGR